MPFTPSPTSQNPYIAAGAVLKGKWQFSDFLYNKSYFLSLKPGAGQPVRQTFVFGCLGF